MNAFTTIRFFFFKCLDWLRWIFGQVPKSAIGSPWLFRTINFIVWAIIIGLCAYFSRDILGNLEPKTSIAWVNRCWLGIVVLLCYLICRILLYILGLLRIEDRPEFEDIDRCWFAGMEALERERLDFQWIPVFLVNGLTGPQEQSLFKSAEIPWRVIAPPLEDTAAVLRFFANEDQVFISCTGVGAMNRQLNRPAGGGSGATTSMAGNKQEAAPTGTLRSADLLGGGAGAIPPPAAPAATPMGTQMAPPAAVASDPAPGPAPATGILGTLRSVGSFVASRTMVPGAMNRVTTAAPAQTGAKVSPISSEEIEFSTKRMEYVCDLLLRDRAPYCPTNGMIQAAPLAWSADEEATRELSPVAVHDLRTLHRRLGQQFPVALLMTGLDQLSGLPGFIRRCGELDPRFRSSRAGSRFPSGAEINDQNSSWLIDRALSWFRGWVYAVFSRDLKNPDNKRLYHLLCELNRRRERLGAQVKLSLGGVRRNPVVRLSGCYFAATGDATNYQGFVKGLLMRLVSTQGEVAWSPEHIQGDSRSRIYAYLLFGATLLIVVANIFGYLYLNK